MLPKTMSGVQFVGKSRADKHKVIFHEQYIAKLATNEDNMKTTAMLRLPLWI